MIKLPYTFTNIDNQEIVIDLYDIAFIDYMTDEDEIEVISSKREYIVIEMNDNTRYVADLPLSDVLYLSKEYWRIKTKIAIKELFKNN